MPNTYEVELSDGRVVEIEGERPPTEQEVHGLLDPKAAQREQFRTAAESLRRERGFGDVLESLAGGAERALEPLTPAGLLSQPSRAAAALTGKPYADPFQSGRPIVPIPKPTGTGVMAGLGTLGAQTLESLETPEGIVTLPVLPASRAIQALTAGQMAAELPEGVKRAAEVLTSPEATTAEKVVAVGIG